MINPVQAVKSDEFLMRDYQAGSAAAFEQIYKTHSGQVYAYLQRRVQKREEVDEIFQLAWTKFHTSRDQYDPKYNLPQWIFVITRTVLVDHMRKSGRRREQPTELNEFWETVAAADPAETEIVTDPQWFDQALNGLSSDQKQMVKWRVLDELTYSEIASILEKSEQSIRQTISRALRKLKNMKPPQEGERDEKE
ncbi:MAG: sigma-70 family RNA polymerase sigma factor [Methylotenera sp.]|nr:sigma-70 family RNA polymerase sigma factor [Oligoflexia bacterium]